MRFQFVSPGLWYSAPSTKLTYGWEKRFDGEAFSHPEVYLYCFWEEIREFLLIDCTERLNQQVKLLLKNRLKNSFMFLPEALLLFCFVMIWIYFGPILFSLLLLKLSVFSLWLKISLPQFFHFKDEDSIWKDYSVQLT